MTEDNQTKLTWGLVVATVHDSEEVLRFWGYETKPDKPEEIKNQMLNDVMNVEGFKLPAELQKHILIREATEEELAEYTQSFIQKIMGWTSKKEVFEFSLGDKDIHVNNNKAG